jgi:hypothetical protein
MVRSTPARPLVAVVLVVCLASCRGDAPNDERRQNRDFFDVHTRGSQSSVSVERIGFRPTVDATGWEVDLRCIDAEGCAGLVSVSIDYAGGGFSNTVGVSNRIELDYGGTATVKRVERGTVPVAEVASVSVVLEREPTTTSRRARE